MENIFIKLFNMSMIAGWLILAVILIRLLLKKAPKSLQRFMWILVGIRLICPFSLESIMSLIPSSETIPQNIAYAEVPQIHSGIEALNSTVNPIMENSLSPDIAASVNPMQIVIAVASLIWIIGVSVMLIYALISYIRLRRKMTGAVRLKDNIYQSENAVSPFVLGLIKPKIYIPFGMHEAILNPVIAHENSHIRHGDHIIKPLGFLLLTIYWFNPLIWVAYMLLCRDIESACDERVIKKLGADERKWYSLALLECGVSRKSIAACPVAFGEVGVKSRVRNVLSYKKPAFWIIIAAVVCCAIIAVCFMTNPIKIDASSNEKRDLFGENTDLYAFEKALYTAPPISYVPYGDTGQWYLFSNNDYRINYNEKTGDITSVNLLPIENKDRWGVFFGGTDSGNTYVSYSNNCIIINKDTGDISSISSMSEAQKFDIEEWNSSFMGEPYDVNGYDIESCTYQIIDDHYRVYDMNGDIWFVLIGLPENPLILHIWKLKRVDIENLFEEKNNYVTLPDSAIIDPDTIALETDEVE